MPDAYQSDETRSVKRDLAKIAYDFAALKMDLLARRYGVETKYDPSQYRVPAGQRTGGQWAKAPSGSATAKRPAASLGERALGALASNPEAAPAAGALALPLIAGGVGISRAEGLYAVGTGAASGMTPFLGLPFSLITPPTAPITSGSLTPTQRRLVADQCYSEYEDLVAECNKLKSPKSRAQCFEQASDWYADCIRRGASVVRQPYKR